MTESEATLKPVILKSKLIFGCLLCRRNYPHVHEEEIPTLAVKKSPNKSRTLLLMKDIQRLFFQNYRGRWFTIRAIDETSKP